MGKKHLKNNIVVIMTVFIVAAIFCCVGVYYVASIFMPSKEIMELTDYYPVPSDEVMIVMQDKVEVENGLYIDQVAYVNFDLVKDRMNKRFYWDGNEHVLSYTTPNELIRASLGASEYSSGKKMVEEGYPIAISQNDKLYLAIPFVDKYSNIKYEIFQNPNRMVIQCEWGRNILYANVKKETQMRFEPSIKSDILVSLAPDERLVLVDTGEEIKKGFYKAMTNSGVIGYVKSSHLYEGYYEELVSDFKEEVYSNIQEPGKVNLVWHNVTSMEANEDLVNLLNKTKGVTVVSPTWFSTISNEGEISSLASEKYVKRAHEAGVKVWGLCDDFGRDMKIGEVLAYTSRRQKLIKELMSAALKYDLDGINIDFEYIQPESGEDFIQFIRELSIKCRANDIVLSIDNYVPMPHTAHYDREEQGIVADYVITMAYDEHYAGGGKSGSVSSIGFVRNAVENIVGQVPSQKVIMALPFYTRLWEEKDGEVNSQALGMNGADKVLQTHGLTKAWDEETQQFYVEFKSNDALYKMWMEEEESLEKKLDAVLEHGVAGVAFWKYGFEREATWDMVVDRLKLENE